MADTKVSAMTNASALVAADEFHIEQSGNDRAASVQQLGNFIINQAAGTTMAAGGMMTTLVLAANSSDIASTTLTEVMEMTAVGAGRYHFLCLLVYQSGAGGTGINVSATHSGTTTQWLMEARFTTTGSLASSHSATMAAQTTTVGMYESEGERTKGAAIGTLGNLITSVDAGNTDLMITIEGFFVVSVSGDFSILLSSETGTAVRAMQGSSLKLKKLS